MARVNKELYLFVFALVGMIGMIACILMGHNSHLITAFIGLNGLSLAGGVYKSVKGGKDDGKS